MGSLMSPTNQYRENAEQEAYGLSSLSKQTTTCYHLQLLEQRHNIFLSYFKTLSSGPVSGLNLSPLPWQSNALHSELA